MQMPGCVVGFISRGECEVMCQAGITTALAREIKRDKMRAGI